MVISNIINYKNFEGENILGFHDYSENSCDNKTFIVIPPSYGETKTDSISLSYFLAVNGLNVIRYDGTKHVGESEGEIFNFTLNDGKKDLISTINFIEKQFGKNNIAVVAKSLAWRFAIRAATEDKRITFLLGIGGIVDLSKTLKAVYQEDLIDIVLKKKYQNWKFADIFGFEVNRDFLETAIRDNYHNLESTKDDLKRLAIPTVYLFAEKDVWIDIHDVEEVMRGKKSKSQLYIIPKVLHQINENPEAALYAFRQTVQSCKKYLHKKSIDFNAIVKPDIREVAAQKRLEKNRLKTHELTKEEERNFWQKYLTKYVLIKKSKDFRDYLDFIAELLGEYNKDELILDAGCGPGYFGAWLYSKYKNNLPTYIGIDFLQAVLKKASTKYFHHISKDKMLFLENKPKLYYVCGDLEICLNSSYSSLNSKYYLCFKDKTFDKICCSLLISYIREPLSLLKEFFRTIKSNGKIVVTTLKPYTDLSQIYRDFAGQTKSKKEIEEARKLLSYAGRIKQKESEGYYQFYSEKDLNELLEKAGFRDIKCYRTLGNQVNVAVAMRK